MTSELLSKLISFQANLSSTPPYQNDISEKQNNLNPVNCIPQKESQKYIQLENLQLNNNNSSLIPPSFSHYINPQKLTPYDDMLIKNIRTFNLLESAEKNKNKYDEKTPKEKNKSIIPIIEINFKFTCDYESIENEIKEFFELFGEINSLDYNMNNNSAKINYKYSFSTIYANYYLNHLLNEKNEKENSLLNKEINENKISINVAQNFMKTPEEKQNEEIIKFIKFLTDNYKNESKNKNGENENESNIKKEKVKCGFSIEKDNKNNEKYNSEIKYSSSLDKNSIINTEKKCYSNNNNSSKYLVLQQNSETPIKKTNTINNYSANNINQNQNSNKIIENENQQNNIYSMPTPINQSFSTPMIYIPFVPKMNMGIPISIPVLFPMNSPFLNKSFYLNEQNNKNEKCEKCENCKKCENCENNAKKENNINSCLMITNDNPININDDNVEKCEKDNSQNQNDNHIKEIFENLNNKIAIISNISNNSTNSNEKNMKNVENNNENNESSSHKTNSELDSNNKILNSKSDSTIKTEEVNKSSNTNSNNNSDDNKKNKDKNINNNSNSNSSDKNSLNFDIISSFKGKTVSLEKLNNYLENNKPMSSFANPKLSLSSEKKNNSPKKIEISNFNKNYINNNTINNKDNNINNINKNDISTNIHKTNFENKKNNFFPPIPPMNNFFNSMYNFLFLPNIIPNPKIKEIMQKIKSQLPNPNNYNFKQNPIYFNKNVIDFNKLTLETKNRVHFTTHSSRDYYYKYVCNYIVQIENDNFFMVTKRIIGKNGCFLKKILQESCIKYGDFSTKIRLRGKGSGYIDKISKTESDDEPLTLSVSSLNYPTYYNCCLLIDNLMNKIYDDYFKHLHNVLPKELHYSIHKKQLLKNEFIVDRVNSINSMYSNSENNSKINNKDMNDKKEKKSDNIDCNDKGKCE